MTIIISKNNQCILYNKGKNIKFSWGGTKVRCEVTITPPHTMQDKQAGVKAEKKIPIELRWTTHLCVRSYSIDLYPSIYSINWNQLHVYQILKTQILIYMYLVLFVAGCAEAEEYFRLCVLCLASILWSIWFWRDSDTFACIFQYCSRIITTIILIKRVRIY